jgi:hypothetical protein
MARLLAGLGQHAFSCSCISIVAGLEKHKSYSAAVTDTFAQMIRIRAIFGARTISLR